jgi:hypothetical protein
VSNRIDPAVNLVQTPGASPGGYRTRSQSTASQLGNRDYAPLPCCQLRNSHIGVSVSLGLESSVEFSTYDGANSTFGPGH